MSSVARDAPASAVRESATAGLRREPKQARSRAKFDRVVEATKDLVVDIGPTATTTTAIAERADVSVAWIYDYFEDRQAIFDAIIVDGSRRLLGLTRHAMLDAVATDGWRGAARAALDVNVAFKVEEPAFVRLWDSSFRSVEALQAHELNDSHQADWVYATLIDLGLMVPGEPTRLAVELTVALTDRGLELCHNHPADAEPVLLDRLHAAMVAILEPFGTHPA